MKTLKIIMAVFFILCLSIMPVSAFEDNFDDGEIASDWDITGNGVITLPVGGMPSDTSEYYLNIRTNLVETTELTNGIGHVTINYMSVWIKCSGGGAGTSKVYYDSNNYISFSATSSPEVYFNAIKLMDTEINTWYKIEVLRSGSNFVVTVYDEDLSTLYQTTTPTGDVIETTEAKISVTRGNTYIVNTIIDDYKLLTVSPELTNNIEWGLDQYTEGDTASYSWTLQNSFWQDLLYKYQIQILKDGSEIDTVKVSQTGTRFQDVDTAGTYEVKLQYSGLWPTNWNTIDSDSVNVVPRVDSFINVPQTAEQKTNFTVNYLYGTTPPTAAIFVKKLDEQLEAYVPYDIIYLDGGTANTEYSQNISIWGEGFYKLVLYNANVPEADLKTDVIKITKVIIPPQTNINTSRIRSQLDNYSVSDMVWGDYAVDFTNYTAYTINLELYNYEYDSIVYSETVGDQSGVVLIPLYSSDLTVFTGLNNIRLSSYTNTGVFVDDIVHDNFTINLVNAGGYGLTLSKYEVYTDETFVIKCIIPQASTVRIINRLTLEEIDNFGINTSSYTNYKISQIGDYEIRLISDSGYVEGNQYIKVVEGTIIDDPVIEDDDVTPTQGTIEMVIMFLSMPAFWGMIIWVGVVGGAAQSNAVNRSSTGYIAFALGNILAIVGMFAPYTMYVLVILWIGAGVFFKLGREAAGSEEY